MATFGELVPGPKLGKESDDDAGTAQQLPPGPLDLESGVVVLRPRPARAPEAE